MRRSRRARLWITWALRDARRRWLQVVSIGLLLALGVGMYSAMSSMAGWRTASADASFAALRTHDLRVSLAPGSYANAGTFTRALGQLPNRRAVVASEERLVVPTQVDASAGRKSIIVPGRVVGASPDGSVDALAVVKGRGLPRSDGAPVVVLERNFAKHYGLAPTGTVTLTGGRRVPYVGQALAPEYFIVTAPGADFGAESSFAVVFASLRTAQTLSGEPGRVNEAVLRVRPGTALAELQAELGGALRRELPSTGFTFTAGSQEAARRLLYKDAQGDQQMMDIFAFLLLGAAAFAAFNLVSRTVEAQRREIGIGMALGVRRRALALRPIMLGSQVALIGIALGVPAGLAANAWLRSVIENFFPLPVWKTPLDVGVFARAAALGLAASLIATAIPLRRALAVAPVEAIRVGARAAKSSGLAWMTRRMRLPGGTLSNMPLRNVLRTPRRTAMTVLGVGAVVAITIALAGVIDSFNTTLHATRSEALAGARQRLTVDLAAPQPPDGPAPRAIARLGAVGAVQPSLRLAGSLSHANHRINAFVETVAPRRPLWHPTLAQGTLPGRSPGLLIASRAAQDLHVRIGDTVVVTYPVSTGPSSAQLIATRLPVTGIHASPLRFLAYVNPSAAVAMHIAGRINRVSVIPSAGHTAADVKRSLLALPSVTAVQGAAAATDAVDETMSQFTDVLVVTVGIALVMSLLIAYNAAAINTEERSREHATLFAYGVEAKSVMRGNIIEALLIGLLATGLGIAAGYGILRWIVGVSMPDTMPDLGILVSIAPMTFALALLAGTVSVALAPLLTTRRLRRTDIPSALRVVE